MKNLTKAKAFWITCLLSVLLFMVTCWSAAFGKSAPYWAESSGFFLLTYLCIDEFSKRIQNINPWSIGFAAILGQLLLHIPMRATDFSGSMGSLMIVVSCFIAILLAVICWKDKRSYSFILSYIVWALFNCFVPQMWSEYLSSI